jgi:Na+-transporting methylmalonyl-CoA/oxaloacetate decarboxylase gamma subunit
MEQSVTILVLGLAVGLALLSILLNQTWCC